MRGVETGEEALGAWKGGEHDGEVNNVSDLVSTKFLGQGRRSLHFPYRAVKPVPCLFVSNVATCVNFTPYRFGLPCLFAWQWILIDRELQRKL